VRNGLSQSDLLASLPPFAHTVRRSPVVGAVEMKRRRLEPTLLVSKNVPRGLSPVLVPGILVLVDTSLVLVDCGAQQQQQQQQPGTSTQALNDPKTKQRIKHTNNSSKANPNSTPINQIPRITMVQFTKYVAAATLAMAAANNVQAADEIVGRVQATAGAYPWMVSLGSGGRHFCVGSLSRANQDQPWQTLDL
jgi:hypothetical protein